jgi:putative Ca2+/H+ antiporter (TMEM165/GDT1 family)
MGLGGNLSRRFVEALGKSIGVIGASEIGDKTFFIAAVMAMRSSRLTVMPAVRCRSQRSSFAAWHADCVLLLLLPLYCRCLLGRSVLWLP